MDSVSYLLVAENPDVMGVFSDWVNNGCPLLKPLLAIEDDEELKKAVQDLDDKQARVLLSYVVFRLQNVSARTLNEIFIETAQDALDPELTPELADRKTLLKYLVKAKNMIADLK